MWRLTLIFVHQQGPEFNGYLVGRGNSRDIDLNRNFPDLNGLMYYYEKTNGRNHHLPLPDNWEQQVSQCCWETQDLTSPIHVQSACLCWCGPEGRGEDGWAQFSHWCECVLSVWMWAWIASHCNGAESGGVMNPDSTPTMHLVSQNGWYEMCVLARTVWHIWVFYFLQLCEEKAWLCWTWFKSACYCFLYFLESVS